MGDIQFLKIYIYVCIWKLEWQSETRRDTERNLPPATFLLTLLRWKVLGQPETPPVSYMIQEAQVSELSSTAFVDALIWR